MEAWVSLLNNKAGVDGEVLGVCARGASWFASIPRWGMMDDGVMYQPRF